MDTSKKRRIIAGVSILLFLVSLLFCIQIPGLYLKSIGEQIFDYLNMDVYSEGTKGWYYPGILSTVGMFVAIGMFSWTREKPWKTLNLLLSIFLVAAFFLWMV